METMFASPAPFRSDWCVCNEVFRDQLIDEPANTVFVNCEFISCSWPPKEDKRNWHARDCRFVECEVLSVGGRAEDGTLHETVWGSVAGCDIITPYGTRTSTDRNGRVYDHELREWLN